MRDKIERKRDIIREHVGKNGESEGSEIATQEEMCWLVEQAARDGILLSVRAQPNTWKQGDECYYYYIAMSIKGKRQYVRMFIDTYPLMTVSDLDKMLKETTDNPQAVENIKKILRLIQARDRRRRKRELERKREEEQYLAERKAAAAFEAECEEFAKHGNDLNWLVDRIETMGWEVTLRRNKPQDAIQGVSV